jgi:hypothetical protein
MQHTVTVSPMASGYRSPKQGVELRLQRSNCAAGTTIDKTLQVRHDACFKQGFKESPVSSTPPDQQ